MGTIYNIKIISKPLENILLSKIQSSIDSTLLKVNQQMSTYIKDSEISQFNNHKTKTNFKVSSEFAEVLKEALIVNKFA